MLIGQALAKSLGDLECLARHSQPARSRWRVTLVLGTLVAAGCTGRRAETVGRHRKGRLSVQGARRPPKYPGKARVGHLCATRTPARAARLTPRRLRAEPPSCQWDLGHRGALLPPLIIVPASYRHTYALDHPTQTPWPLAPLPPFIAISSTIPLSSPLIHRSVHSAAHCPSSPSSLFTTSTKTHSLSTSPSSPLPSQLSIPPPHAPPHHDTAIKSIRTSSSPPRGPSCQRYHVPKQ